VKIIKWWQQQPLTGPSTRRLAACDINHIFTALLAVGHWDTCCTPPTLLQCA